MTLNTSTALPSPDRSERLDRVVTEYLKAMEAGDPVDPQEWIARHPDLADELRAYFTGEQQFNRLATPLQTPAALGTVRYFGDYELVEEIARGGMGVVYKARQVSLNRAVALKMLLSGHFAGEDDLRRFRTEAEAAARLDHPNILPVYEVGEHNGLLYFTMKLIDGGSLAGRMDEFRQHPRQVVELLIAVARGVHHAHQRGILHRDLKPSNVLLGGETPYIADFGLARKVEPDSNLTQTGAIVGTPSYMAPEQAQARKDLSTAIDVYSLGAILYEVLTGKPPFSAPTAVETIMQVLEKEPAAPHTLQPNVDRDLETIALMCLDKTPQKRYDSAAALADDLERWQRGEPILARPAGRVERTVKWVRRHAVVSALAAAILFVLLGGIAASSYFAVTANLAAAEARKAEAFAELEKERADQKAEDANNEKERADQKAEDAEREKQRADRKAEDARREAERADRKADDAKREAERADREAKDARWQMRVAKDARQAIRVDLALRARDEFDFTRMGTILADMDADYSQAWETGYIRGLWLRHAFPLRSIHGPFNDAKSLVYSPDGKRILAGYRRILDGETGQDKVTLKDTPVSAAWSPDSKQILSVVLASGVAPAVVVWDAETGQEVKRFAITEPSMNDIKDPFLTDNRRHVMACSSDARCVLTASSDNTARLWDVETGKERAILKGHTARIADVAVSPDSKSALTGSHDGTVRIWEVESGKEKLVLNGDEESKITDVAWSPDGKRIVAGSNRGNYCFDAQTGKELKLLGERERAPKVKTKEKTPIRSVRRSGATVTWSPDGKQMLLSDGRIVDAETGHARTVPINAGWNLQCRCWSPDGTRVCDGQAIVDAKTGQVLYRFNIHGQSLNQILSMAWSPDGKRVFLGGGNRRIDIWNPNIEQEEAARNALGSTSHQVWSPDLRRLFTWNHQNGRIVDLDTGREMVLSNYLTSGSVSVWSPDQKRVLTWKDDETAQIWNAETKKVIAVLKGAGPTALFSPDGKRILTQMWSASARKSKRNQNNALLVWDAETGQQKATFESDTSGPKMTWSPDSKHILTVSSSFFASKSPARVFDAETGERKLLLEEVNHPMWSPDGKTLAAANSNDNTVRIWDIQTGKEKVTLEGHKARITTVEFSPDGKTIMTEEARDRGKGKQGKQEEKDESTRLWDAGTGQLKVTLEGSPRSMGGPVSWSPDSKYIVTSPSGLAVGKGILGQIWEVETGKIKTLEGLTSSLGRAVWSPDGKQILTTTPTRWDTSSARSARIWDLSTGQEKVAFEGTLSPSDRIEWSPDGKRILSWSGERVFGQEDNEAHRTVTVWDALTGKAKAKFAADGVRIPRAAWSLDSKRIYTAGTDGAARIWDADTGKEVAHFEGGDTRVSHAAWSSDGKRVVTGSSHSVRLWDAATGKVLVKREWYNGEFGYLACSPDGANVLTTGNGQPVRIHNIETGKEPIVLKGITGTYAYNFKATFSPDGKRVFTRLTNSPARVWDVETGQEKVVLQGESNSSTTLSWSPDGKYILGSGFTSTHPVRVWDAETGQVKVTLLPSATSIGKVAAAWSPDGTRIVTGADNYTNSTYAPGLVTMWDVKTGQQLFHFKAHSLGVLNVAWSPDGKRLLTGSKDGTIRVWDAETTQEMAILKGLPDEIHSVTWSSDGSRVLAKNRLSAARFWCAEVAQEKASLGGHTSGVYWVAWSRDSKLVLTGDQSGTVRVWDALTAKERVRRQEDLRVLTAAGAFSPDSKLIASVSGRDAQNASSIVAIWDAETAQTKHVLKGYSGNVQRLEWSPDGKFVIAIGRTTIQVWDVATGQGKPPIKRVNVPPSFNALVTLGNNFMVWSTDNQMAWSFDGKAKAVSGGTAVRISNTETGKETQVLQDRMGGISCIAFSPDGKQIVTGNRSGMVRIWDTVTGEEQALFRGHVNQIFTLAFSPDGKWVVTGSTDNTARIWEIASAQPLPPADGPGLRERLWAEVQVLMKNTEEAESLTKLGHAQRAEKKIDDAIVSFCKVVELTPNDSLAHSNLGHAHLAKGTLGDAITSFRRVTELTPFDAGAFNTLGHAQWGKNQPIEAEASFRRAIALSPKFAHAHFNLGQLLSQQEKLSEAVASLRQAIALDPRDISKHSWLGFVLRRQGKLDEAIATYRKALEIDPKNAWVHFNLGQAFSQQQKLPEATMSLRQAVALDPRDAQKHTWLGVVLQRQGKLDEALACHRKALEIAPKYAWAQTQLAQTQRLVAAQDNLIVLQKGEFKPTTNDERFALAELCQIKKLYRTGAGVLADAVAADPKLPDNVQAAHLYNAACFAALAVAGQGEDAANLDDKERARLRKQALDGLRTALAVWLYRLENNQTGRAEVLRLMKHWQKDSDLVGVRDQTALAKLAAEERTAFTKFWEMVALLAQP